MEYKNILKVLLIIIFLTGTLNFVYADEGPGIGPNQAKKIAQDYLNSNNLPYTATTPGDDDQQVKVKDTQTGEVKWISITLSGNDVPDSHGKMRYEQIDSPIWIVQVNDKNGKNVGQIYTDDYINQVLKVTIDGKILKDVLNQREELTEDYYASLETNDTPDATDQVLQGLFDNIIFEIIFLIIGTVIGFLILIFQVLLDNLGITLVISGIIILIMEIGVGYMIYKRM